MSSMLQEIDIFGGGKKEEIKGLNDSQLKNDIDLDINELDLDSYNSDNSDNSNNSYNSDLVSLNSNNYGEENIEDNINEEDNEYNEDDNDYSNTTMSGGGKKKEEDLNIVDLDENLDIEMSIDNNNNNNNNLENNNLDNDNLDNDNLDNDNINNIDNNNLLDELDENNTDEDDDENKYLELERGTLVKLLSDKDEKKKNYIIVQVKDVFFDNDLNTFIRRYIVRELNNNKLSHNKVEILSNDIEEIKTVKEVRELYNDMEYSEEGDKEIDNEENKNTMEEIEPAGMNNLDEPGEIDYNITDMSDDIILDVDETFDFTEVLDDEKAIEIEEELKESEILFTEYEQEEDIIDEMIRMLPESRKFNKNEIKKIGNKVRKFQFLKNKHSEFSIFENKLMEEEKQNENLENLKQNVLLKGQNYKPIMNKLYNNDFSNKYLIPIVQTNLKLYEKDQTEEMKDKEISTEILEQIESAEKVVNKYRNNMELDYESMNSELEELAKGYKLNGDYHTKRITKLNNDTTFVNNYDVNNKDELDIIKFLGKDTRKDEYDNDVIYNKGERVNITGFIHVPELFNSNDKQLLVDRSYSNVVNTRTIYEDKKENDMIKIKEIDGNNRFQIGQKVKVCIKEEDFNIIGVIKDVRRGFIYLEPDNKKLIDLDKNILEFDSLSKLLKINKINDVLDYKDKCYTKEDNDKIRVYLFSRGLITDKNYENILDSIIPSNKVILDREKESLDKINNYLDLNNILNKYNLEFLDLEINQFKRINKILNSNEKKLLGEFLPKIAKINRNKSTYFKDLKNIQDKRLKDDYDFITNENIENSNKYYSEYIYRINSFDDTTERTKWLYSQEDFGRIILLQKLLLKIQDEKKKLKVTDIEGKIKEIEEENGRIKDKLIEEERKNDFFNLKKKNKCREVETKIVKIYLTLRELEEDNYKNLTVDKHYLIGDPSNPINKVKPGDYCILKHPDNPSQDVDKIDMTDKIFKRIVVGDGKQEIWVMESKLKINDFLNEAQNYCNKLIGLGKDDEENSDKCAFDRSTAQCIPNRIMRLRKGYKDNEEVIEKLNKKVKTIDNTDKEQKIEILLKLYQNRGILNLLNIKTKLDKKREDVKITRQIPLEIDESELLDYTFLKRLEQDLSNPEKKEELLLQVREKYGIDFLDENMVEGEEREIFTMGDFNDKGQRIELTEVMPNENEKEEIEMSNNDILDAIKSYLSDTTSLNVYKEEYKKSGDDSYEKIENIVDTLLNIMGVNINKDKLIKLCLVLVEDNLLTYNEFVQNKYVNRGKTLPKKSKIESQYNGYRLQTIIFITSAKLLVYLQLELNNYFLNPFEKCVANIYGYPLTDIENLTAVEYVACILNNLSSSGKYWESIVEFNKSKIIKRLLTYLDLIVSNVNIKLKLEEKLVKIDQLKAEYEEIEQSYQWNEFRPPFKTIQNKEKSTSLDLNDVNCSSSKSIKAGLSEFREDNYLTSLKIIDRINNVISSQEIENVKYDPIPLANICCLSDVNKEYDYYSYLNQKDGDNGLSKLIEKSKNMDKCGKKLFSENINLTYLKPTKTRQKLRSFANNVFPRKNDIDNTVGLLYNNFIYEGVNLGKKRIFDINNICQITGEHKSEIAGKKFSKDNYHELLLAIHKRNQVIEKNDVLDNDNDNDEDNNTNDNNNINNNNNIENENNDNINRKEIKLTDITLNKLKNVLDKDIFKENKYLKDLVEKELDNLMEKNGNDDIRLWDRMEQEILNEKMDLIKVLSKSVDRKNIMMLDKILDGLTRFKNLEADDNMLIEEMENEKNKMKLKKKCKLKQFKRSEVFYNKYIINYLKKYINVLANKNMNYNTKVNDSDSQKIRKTEKILNDINEDEYGFLNKYRNGRCRKLFLNLKNVLSDIKEIKDIRGYDDIYDGNDNIIHRSKFNFVNSAKLLEFLFIYLLNLVIDSCDNIKDKKKIKVRKESKKDLSNSDMDEEDGIVEIGTDNHTIICNFIVDLLFKIEQDRKFNDKYAQSLVEKNIKTKNEESKDRNLLTMELLDLETRRLRNELTKAGITKYADLASDFKDLLEEEDKNRDLLEEFKKIHGNNFTEDQFENFKENKEKEMRLENEIRKDNEEYLDAEGDDELEI